MLIIHRDTWQLLGLKAPCTLDVFENIRQRNLLGIFSKTKLFMSVLGNSKLKKKKKKVFVQKTVFFLFPPSQLLLSYWTEGGCL